MSAKRQRTSYRRWLAWAGVVGFGVAVVSSQVVGDARKVDTGLKLDNAEGRVDTAEPLRRAIGDFLQDGAR
jgi:hypothetical protein